MLKELLPKVEFQQRAKAEGKAYEDTCVKALMECGFDVVGTSVVVRQCGVQIDILARNRHRIYFPWECKGGMGRGQKEGGFLSSDNVKKAVGSATSLANSLPWITGLCTPMMVMTPFLRGPKWPVFAQIASLPVQTIADVVDDRDSASLKRWANMDYFSIEAYLRDINLLGFRLFQNKHWGLNGSASDYFAMLEALPKLSL